MHAPRHGRRQRPTKLEEQVKRSSLTGTQWHPGAPRFPAILYLLPRALGRSLRQSRTRPLGHRKNLHWSLDVTFNEDQSRLRAGHGAKNMAVVRHFALNLVRQVADKRSIKRRRKRASWDPKYLLEILGPPQLNLDSLPWVWPTRGLLAGRGGLLCFGLAAIQQWRRIIIHASR